MAESIGLSPNRFTYHVVNIKLIKKLQAGEGVNDLHIT